MKNFTDEENEKLKIGKQLILINKGYISSLTPEINGNGEKELSLKKGLRKVSAKKKLKR